MSDIKQRLRMLESSLISREGFVSQDVDVLRAAMLHIEQLESVPAPNLNHMYLAWAATLGDPKGTYDVLTGSKAAFTAGVASALFHSSAYDLKRIAIALEQAAMYGWGNVASEELGAE